MWFKHAELGGKHRAAKPQIKTLLRTLEDAEKELKKNNAKNSNNNNNNNCDKPKPKGKTKRQQMQGAQSRA